MEQSTDPQDREAQAFAGEIAQHVEHGRREGSFEALVLVAPPKFLGLLRSELNKLTRDRVVAEINKNLVEADQKTIEHQLSEAIP